MRPLLIADYKRVTFNTCIVNGIRGKTEARKVRSSVN
jgi:hypothetical protein